MSVGDALASTSAVIDVGDSLALTSAVVSNDEWNPKSRSILGVRSNRLCRLLSEGGSVLMEKFLGLFSVRDSSETSRIIDRQLGRGIANKRDCGGISGDGEASGS
jgi:hypothetical protein